MRFVRILVATALALTPFAASAQTTPPNHDKWGITVTGQRAEKGSHVAMSEWRVAETDHVVVYSKNDDRLVRIAHNLEKLHFLLSVLFNRVDKPDDTIKLRVLLIGDSADFRDMNLRNLRWQQGPYPRAFPVGRYYDPRDDGAVIATTYTDQKIILQPASIGPYPGMGHPTSPDHSPRKSLNIPDDLAAMPINEISFIMPAEGRLYATFAQHYLMTYFPAAYPRWYLEGFGEIFSTLNADKDGVIEYGAQPEGLRKVNEWFGFYPIRKLIDGTYLHDPQRFPRWTPYRAWQLAHLLFFSEDWQAPLHDYLAAVARGASPDEAARALGDLDKLQKLVAGYHGRKAPYERMIYPPDRAAMPIVRNLTRNEAVILRGRLELGARVDIPEAPAPGTDPATAQRMEKERRDAIADRDAWLGGLRRNADRSPGEFSVQLLLAEAECRTGNHSQCLAAADRALALAPESSPALAWKGVALVDLAIAGPANAREARLAEGRALIIRANRADTEATLPLIAYYRSFVDAGQVPPEIAVLGLFKASQSVPSAPATRLMLGEELARRGDAPEARLTLLPVADGPFDSPERAKAKAVLASIAN